MMMLNRIQSQQTEDGEIGNLEADQGGARPSRQKSRPEDSLPDYNRDVSSIVDPYDNVKSKASAFRRHQDRFSALVNSQYRVKRVEASKQVLGTYHESFLYGKVPSSVKIRAALRAGWIGNIWHFLEFVLALTSGVLYIYSTYYEYTVYNWVSRAQNYISVAFLVDYVLRVYSESVRLYYIFSWWGLVDLLSALPIIFLFRSAVRGGRILIFLQFLRIIRIVSLMSKLGIVGSSLSQQILLLVTSTFGAGKNPVRISWSYPCLQMCVFCLYQVDL